MSLLPKKTTKRLPWSHMWVCINFVDLLFGLRNTSATFQRLVNAIFADMLIPRDEDPYLSAYVDYLLCHSAEWKQPQKLREHIFILCDNVGLALEPCIKVQTLST